MVEQDSPWTDFQRGRLLALAQYRRDVHTCGLHRSLLDDPENVVLVPDQEHCAVCAELARQERIAAEADKAFEKQLGNNPSAKVKRPRDGRSIFLRPATAAELAKHAAARARRTPKQRGKRRR